MDSGSPLFQVHAFLVVWLFLASTACHQCCGNEAQIWSPWEKGQMWECLLKATEGLRLPALRNARRPCTGVKQQGLADALTKPEGN